MPEQPSRIRAAHSAEGGVVMDLDRGKLFSLNGTASAMYKLLAAGLTEQAIVDELTQRFNMPADTVKHDLCEFRSALRLHAIEPRPVPHRSDR